MIQEFNRFLLDIIDDAYAAGRHDSDLLEETKSEVIAKVFVSEGYSRFSPGKEQEP